MVEYPDSYPEEYVDEARDEMEDQAEVQQEVYEDTSAPTWKEKDDLYTLFWRVLGVRDSSKVGNLDKFELGMLNISVRDCLRIALLSETLGHDGFADFFMQQAQIVLRTSASKKGWLPELFVTRKTERMKRREEIARPQPQQKKKFKLI